MSILLTGSNGLIGTAFAAAAADRGVRPLSRTPGGDGLHWDPQAGRIDPLPPCEAVVHLAGAGVADRRWSAARKALIRDSRIDGTRLVAETLAAMDRPPSVLVCASAVGFYGDGGDTVHRAGDEAGSGFLAAVCQDWEAAAEPARAAGIRVVHLRFGVVLAAEGGALARMVPPFRWGLGGPIGGGRQWLSWLSLRDACRLITTAIDDPRYQGPIDAVAPEPCRQGDFARTLGRVLHRPAIATLPAWVVRLVFGEMGTAVLLGSSRVPGQALAELGFTWQDPQLEPCLQTLLA